MISFSTRHLAQLSRDRKFLIRTSMGIVAMSFGLALLTSFLTESKDLTGPELFPHLETATPTSDDEWVQLIRIGYLYPNDLSRIDCRAIVKEFFAIELPDQLKAELNKQANIQPLYRALRIGNYDKSVKALERIPAESRYRDELLGDLHFIHNNYVRALHHYRAEFEQHPKSIYSRRSAVIAAWREADRETVQALLSDAETRSCFGDAELLDIFADTRDYPGLALAVVSATISALMNASSTIPFALSAAIWFLILTAFWQFNRARAIAGLFAFGIGLFSSICVFYAVYLQERIYGFTLNPEDTPLSQFIYWVAGVGLREETLKLLCFIPLGIWIARRNSKVEALVLAGITGLGFAFAENCVSYQTSSFSTGTWSRFLTANAIHISLTGILGFYFCKMLMQKFRGWEEFLASFIAVVAAHGIYDATIAMPSLSEYAILSPILVALIAYQYFDPLRSVLDSYSIHKRASPLGVFVLGSVALTCIALISSSSMMPLRIAVGVFAASIGGMIPLAFAYISRFRDL